MSWIVDRFSHMLFDEPDGSALLRVLAEREFNPQWREPKLKTSRL